MIVRLAKFKSLVSINIKFLFFELLLFSYFLTLHADQLQGKWGGYTLRLNNFVALLLLGFFILRWKQKIFHFPKWMVKAFGFLSLSLLVSLIFSPFTSRCTLFFVFYAVTLVCYFAMPYLLMKFYSAERVLRLYFLSFLCVGSYALLQFLISCLGIHDPFAVQFMGENLVRPNALSYEPSYYALYMTPFVMMVNLHFLTQKKKNFFVFKRVGFKEIIFVNLLYLLSTTTSAFFGYFVFFLVAYVMLQFSFFKNSFRGYTRAFFKFGMSAICAFSLFCLLFPDFVKRFFLKFFFEGFMTHSSFYERWVGIKNAWTLFLQNPVVGVGLGAYPEVLHQKWLQQEKDFTYLFGHEALYSEYPLKFFEPHNLGTELLASLGIIGFAACLTLIFCFYRATKKAFFETEEEERRHWIFLMLVSCLVTLIVLQFNQGFLRPYIWVHFGVCAGYIQSKTLIATQTCC